MSVIRSLFILFILTLIAGPMTGEAVAAPTEHKKCITCHLDRNNLSSIKNINTLCLGCHPANTKDHKLDVVSNTAPVTLPLSNGRITCNTCHDPHGKKTAGEPLLRLDPATLCVSCHPKK
ncbi:MAG TPA: cytochrome c3 family protein [Nitrospirota bacterium]|nr:cytochrome c3 family protein [Nitrospirota bacterium]